MLLKALCFDECGDGREALDLCVYLLTAIAQRDAAVKALEQAFQEYNWCAVQRATNILKDGGAGYPDTSFFTRWSQTQK